MWKKAATIAVIAVLGAALLVGSVYIVLRPDEARADGRLLGRGNGVQTEAAHDCGHEESACEGESGEEHEYETLGPADQSGGYGRLECDSRGQGGNADGRGNGPSGRSVAADWVTVEGRVVDAEHGILIETADGQVVEVHTGPEWYWDENDYVVNAGDEVRVQGLFDDHLEAGQIENLSSGQLITLRNADGVPLWSGRGRRGRL
jgi:hypothetical protein